LEDAAADLEAGGQSVCHHVWRTLHKRDSLKPGPAHTEFLTRPQRMANTS